MSLINRLDRWFDSMMLLPQDRMAAPQHSPRKKGYIRVKVGRFWKTVKRTHRKVKRIRRTIHQVGRAFQGDQRASQALHKRLFPGTPHNSTATARRRSLAKTARTAKRPTAAKRPRTSRPKRLPKPASTTSTRSQMAARVVSLNRDPRVHSARLVTFGKKTHIHIDYRSGDIGTIGSDGRLTVTRLRNGQRTLV